MRIRLHCDMIARLWVLLALLVAAMPRGAEALDASPADADIVRAIENRLMVDDGVSEHQIDVAVQDGIVNLTGRVDHLLSADRAEELARFIRGVRAVINRIEVIPPHRPDNQIQVDISRKLVVDPAIDARRIHVDVEDGVATLTGSIESWAGKELCDQVARDVAGVRAVHNEVDVVWPEERSDADIEADIVRRLENDVRVGEFLVDVTVEDGHVRLSGAVGSLAEKRQAHFNAWVNGVEDVDLSDLEIRWWAGDDMARQTPLPMLSDDEIAAAVRDAFQFDPRVLPFDIDVTVEDGIVTLSGTVDNLQARMAAAADARNTLGVWRVRNHLKVRPPELLSDEDVARAVRDVLQQDPIVDRLELAPSVRAGVVRLEGRVGSKFEKERAEEAAARVVGVVGVENRIEVYDKWEDKSDLAIKRDTESDLFWDVRVDAEDIRVSVADGVVTLTGTVDDWTQWQAAVAAAYDAGARDVRNHLKVRSGPGYYRP